MARQVKQNKNCSTIVTRQQAKNVQKKQDQQQLSQEINIDKQKVINKKKGNHSNQGESNHLKKKHQKPIITTEIESLNKSQTESCEEQIVAESDSEETKAAKFLFGDKLLSDEQPCKQNLKPNCKDVTDEDEHDDYNDDDDNAADQEESDNNCCQSSAHHKFASKNDNISKSRLNAQNLNDKQKEEMIKQFFQDARKKAKEENSLNLIKCSRPHCNYSTKSARYYQLHLRQSHAVYLIKLGICQVACTYCQMGFQREDQCEIHEETQCPKRPLKKVKSQKSRQIASQFSDLIDDLED